MSELPEKIHLFILNSNESPALFITHYTKWVVDLPSFPSFEWDFFIIHSPKGEDLLLGYDFLYHFNPIMDWKTGLITYDSSHKGSSGILPSASNAFATAVNSVALVGELNTPSHPSSVHIPSIIPSQSLLPLRDEIFKEIKDVGEDEQWDEEEEPEEIEKVLKVVAPTYHQYLDVLSKVKAEKLPPHLACDHHIELEGLLTPVGVIYSLSIQESETLWAYMSENRKLNAVTRKSSYPVTPMNQLLTIFNGSTILCKIDLRDAYNLLRIKEGDKHLTAFRAKYESYEYLIMPVGLTNAPASFQNLVNDISSDFLDVFVVVYLDDILVFSSSEEEHVKHVASVLQRLRDNTLFSKASKCVFHASSGEYLGYVVSSDGLKMDSSKVQQILNWPQPKNIKAPQSFCGSANFYCNFIKNYSKKITALTSLLKKDSPFIFNEEALSQFHLLKEASTITPILSHFNPSLPTIVNDSGKHPIAFNSHKLLPAEFNFEINDKELLGIVWALKHWRAFLLSLSNSFEVLTDHSSLQYFMFSKVLTCLQTHWAEFLSEFHFTITYRPGRRATLPDALSCQDDMYPEGGVDFINNNTQSFHQVIKQDGIQESRFFSIKVEIFSDLVDKTQKEVWQEKDYKEMIKQLARGESLPDYSLEPQAKLLLFKDRVVIPSNEELQLNILQKHHDSPLAGHPGQEKTLKLIKRDFHWAGMNQFIKDDVSSCQQCSRNKNIHHKNFGLLKPLQISSGPWNSLSMDFINKLPLSNNFDSILVVVDRFSKIAIFIPTYGTFTALDLA
ncbi:hypothetical protein O181_098822 [Austropuccinia psidii MF-1]|uniref:Reverse transcriptase domain-containing protein n=1 Tax=Austropuccinia psidii MF-1 TaxID=1389203 RepID=A0A9Q3JB66_9BASI|nr:hypothetical protein [Austropuccinia psidii MF-1]